MNRPEPHDILSGTVLEFYESKEILCGVVLAVKDGRFHVLSEKNREITLARSRAIHQGRLLLDTKRGRDVLVKELSEISAARKQLTEQIDLEEVWLLLERDGGEFHPHEIAEFLYTTPVPDNSAAAVNRALLQDRLYFISKDSRFSPRSAEAVDQRRVELQKEAELERKLTEGASWFEAFWNRKNVPAPAFRDELIAALKEYSLFGQEAKEAAFTKEILKRAGLAPQPQTAFRALVKLGVWNEDENLLLHEHGITPAFPDRIMECAERIAAANHLVPKSAREDLTGLAAFTVDSILTRDYDDALSIRELGDGVVEVGVHIADAAEFVSRDDPLDREAEQRVSSIYLPDDRISMFPPALSEGAFSLKAGEDRLALSFLLKMDSDANVLERRIIPTVVRIRNQLTYHDVDSRLPSDSGLTILYELAMKMRQKRLERGAIILPLPEINVYVNSAGMIQVTRYDKETPSQILVSEWMIAANATAADYLADNGIPTIFRGQAECRPETEFVQSDHEIFAVYRQRRLFSRAELASVPKAHCSLALPNYTTVTSPIRRYADLVVQRQLKAALDGNPGVYSKGEVEQLITKLSVAQGRVFTIQRKWTRYWLLKYIEQEDLETLNALVLDKNARFAHLLIPDLFLEINAPVPENAKFRQGEMVRLRIDKVNPREDLLKSTILDSPAR